MAWIELHQAVRDHRKIVAVADVLDIPEPHVIGHLACLWLWSLDNAPDGLLPASNRVIAKASQWTGNSDEWVNALIDCGLIEDYGKDRHIHDWDDYAGKLIERREANTKRMRDKRAQNVQRTDDACAPATVPYSTVPNPTEQNQTKDPPFVPPAGEKTKPKRKAQIPEDWQPDDSGIAFARSRGLETDDVIRDQVQMFRDVHRSKGNTFLDIPAAWRTWCGNFTKFQPRAPNVNGNHRTPKGPDFAALARQMREQEVTGT